MVFPCMDTIIAFCNENFGIVFKHRNRRKQSVSQMWRTTFLQENFGIVFKHKKSAKKPQNKKQCVQVWRPYGFYWVQLPVHTY